MQSVASTRWFLSRLVLLSGLLVGLAAMHTLGHAAMSHTAGMQSSPIWSTTTSTSVPHTAVMVLDDLGTAVSGAVPHPTLDTARMSAGTDDGLAGEGWSVCLAVLATAVMLLLLGWLRSHLRGHGPQAADEPSTSARRRRRPPLPQLALRLVETSVLRR